MNSNICPKCGEPCAWEFWGSCHCGYQFGPVWRAPSPAGVSPFSKGESSIALPDKDGLKTPRKRTKLERVAAVLFLGSFTAFLVFQSIFMAPRDELAAEALDGEAKRIVPPAGSVEQPHSKTYAYR